MRSSIAYHKFIWLDTYIVFCFFVFLAPPKIFGVNRMLEQVEHRI